MEINKIYNGDCFELFKQLQDDTVDYVFTSPPYNRLRNDKYSYYNDSIDDYYSFLCSIVDECLRVTKKYVFLNLQTTYYNSSSVYSLIGKYCDKIQQVIVWEKSNPMPSSGNSITNAYELFIVFGDMPLRSNYTYTKNIITTSVNTNMPKEHKAVMHPDVADWFIRMFTLENETVLDPFMGTGTTAVACVKNHRNYIGFEICTSYCEMASHRVADNRFCTKNLW